MQQGEMVIGIVLHRREKRMESQAVKQGKCRIHRHTFWSS